MLQTLVYFTVLAQLYHVQIKHLFVFAQRVGVQEEIFFSVYDDLALVVEVYLNNFVVQSE